MVVRSFDGPAGQMEDSITAGPRRHPSQPEIDSDSRSGSAQREIPITSGLNLLTVGGAIGREFRSTLIPSTVSKSNSPSRANSSSSKPLPSSRVPRYNLKTIPPKTPNPVRTNLRPGAQHVPGSYRSEVVPTPAGSVGVHTPVLDNRPACEDQHSMGASSYFGLGYEMPPSAIESLQHAAAHSTSQVASPPQEILLSEPLAEQEREVQPVRPVLTLGMDHEHSHGVSPEASSPIQKEARSAQRNSPTNSTTENTRVNAVLRTYESTSSFNGPHISEKLSQLPPIAQVTTNELGDQQLTAKPSIHSMSSMDGSHSEHSKQITLLNVDSNAVGKHSSLLPEAIEVQPLGNKHPEAYVGQKEIHQHRSLEFLSNVSQKLSSVGRSIATLSERSLRSDPRTPSLHSSTKQEKFDLVNGGPRKHWVRQILAKGSGSTTPVGPSNLTARPRHHQSHGAEAAEQQRAASISTGRLLTASTDEASYALQQQKNTESFTRVIVDLESLLREALAIAHQAAGKDHSDDGHAFDQDSENSSRNALEVYDGSSTTSGGQDEEDNSTTLPQRLPLRVPTFHARNSEEERPEVKNGLLENSRPQVLETMYEIQGQPLRGGSESSKIGYDVLPPKSPPNPSNTYLSYDWAYQPAKRDNKSETLYLPQRPIASQNPTQEQRVSLVRARKDSLSIVFGENVHRHVSPRHAPAIQPRTSSLGLRSQARRKEETHAQRIQEIRSSNEDSEDDPYIAVFDAPGLRHHGAPQGWVNDEPQTGSGHAPAQMPLRHDTIMPLPDRNDQPEDTRPPDQPSAGDNVSLTDRHHFSIREPRGFSLGRSHRRAPIARDWSTSRKRYVATVACISTALMGFIIGIYAGEVPAIQYAIIDEHHYTILGNVVFFIGLAISTALFWPLPLLHGRKPYTLAALAILLPLQFPQALAVGTQRSPYVASYRVGLLFPRAISGLIMGFANINFKSTLLDLFGASLQSVHPHQEIVNINDVRRHGGGMGVWLGIWTWCYIGSLGVGFLVGAVIISGLNVAWGFWITILLIAAVLVLNVLVPEVRRSTYRRSMAEVRTGTDVSRRVARGEVKMHLQSTGPIWWWEEVWAGHVLCIRMLKQPGFVVLSLYLGWIYGQIVMVIVVSHSSRYARR